ncbi:MAG TPA: hypothetical protein VLD57_00375, partial [Blastocatellia bacterium]|nr:hypothetical protein [Blastocatellia bacterium]
VSITNNSSAMVSQQTIGVYNLYNQAGGDAGSITKLTSGSARMDGWSGISWTPDGRIVYSSAASGNPDIWMMNPDGTNQKQLTVDLGSNTRGLSVSPDGHHIVFVSQRAEGPHVWRVDIDGGNPKRLTYGRGAFNPFISPDGKWVFYFDGADRPRAWKVPIDGGEPVQLTGPFSDMLPRAFSPDGKLIAFRPSGVGRKLGIASSETGQTIKNIDLPPSAQPRNIQWTPDGQAITYLDNRKGTSNLWLQPLDGGQARQLTDFKEYSIHLFAWSPDGKYLVFNRGFQTSDIVLIKSDK